MLHGAHPPVQQIFFKINMSNVCFCKVDFVDTPCIHKYLCVEPLHLSQKMEDSFEDLESLLDDVVSGTGTVASLPGKRPQMASDAAGSAHGSSESDSKRLRSAGLEDEERSSTTWMRWIGDILRAVRPGKQKQAIRVASLCSGMGTEHYAVKAFFRG